MRQAEVPAHQRRVSFGIAQTVAAEHNDSQPKIREEQNGKVIRSGHISHSFDCQLHLPGKFSGTFAVGDQMAIRRLFTVALARKVLRHLRPKKIT